MTAGLRTVGLLALAALSGAVAAPAAAQPLGAASARPEFNDKELEATVARQQKALAERPTDGTAAIKLGQALGRLGRRAEAEAAYRRAIELLPNDWFAYARLADLVAKDPRRWEQREEVAALLKTGLLRTAADTQARLRLTVSVANFERAVGQMQAARARLSALEGAPLSAELRKRVLDLLDSIQSDEQEGALRDWPEPPIPVALQRELAAAEQTLQDGDAHKALLSGERLAGAAAGWRAPRWLRARAFEALGRFDDAERELTILLQLSPSHAEAWRRLGVLLAAHGGALDAERSDEALRHALALEPAYFDLWLLRAQVALRRGAVETARQALDHYLREALEQSPEQAQDPEVRRLQQAVQAVQPPPGPARSPRASRRAGGPSAKAQELYRQATDWLQSGDPVGLAPDLLTEALADSPAYIDAAATMYALSGQVPPATVTALWQDGEALLELARQIRALANNAETRKLMRPWLDRAVGLGNTDAYFDRGALRIDENDLAAGLEDLRTYVAASPRPAALDDARLLLTAVASSGAVDSAVTRARSRLLAERPQEAAVALGERCDDKTSPPRLLLLGMVREWAGEQAQAVACYRLALRHAAGDPQPLQRLAVVAARAPLKLTAQLEPELRAAAAQRVASAEWALARLLLSRGDTAGALGRIDGFLREASPQDPSRPAAQAARTRITTAWARVQREVLVRRLGVGAGALLLIGGALLWLLRGRSLSRALLRHPALFPEVARTVGELRHDVLKHRTSALGLVAADASVHEQVRGMLWEPERASDLIAAAYARLWTAARAHGVRLRPPGREPIFGPLLRDLRRAESLLMQPRLSPAALQALRRVDGRLRELHSERLGALLRQGPRTRVDAAMLAGWIRDVEAELKVRGQKWTTPVLMLEGLEQEFPVERQALTTLFSNLLRNAQAAVAAAAQSPEAGAASVLVRVGEERDATGRRLLLLLVGDSAPSELTLETVERRESGRGLSIMRDLVHEWRGHLVIRPESAPLKKGVGACFPA